MSHGTDALQIKERTTDSIGCNIFRTIQQCVLPLLLKITWYDLEFLKRHRRCQKKKKKKKTF